MSRQTLSLQITVEQLAHLISEHYQIVRELPPEAKLNPHASRALQGGNQRDPHLAGVQLVWSWEDADA